MTTLKLTQNRTQKYVSELLVIVDHTRNNVDNPMSTKLPTRTRRNKGSETVH